MQKKQASSTNTNEASSGGLTFFQQIATLKLSAYFRQTSQMFEFLGEHTGNINGLLKMSPTDQIDLAVDLIKKMEKMHHTSGEILTLTKAELQTYKLKLEIEQEEAKLQKSKKKIEDAGIENEQGVDEN
jgi:hypothetical protein